MWSQWSECSVTCGGGTRTRTRNCTNPEPMGGGKDCTDIGEPVQEQECNNQTCELRKLYFFHCQSTHLAQR